MYLKELSIIPKMPNSTHFVKNLMTESFNFTFISMSLFFPLLSISETSPNYQIRFSLFAFSFQVNAEGKLKYGLPETCCITLC